MGMINTGEPGGCTSSNSPAAPDPRRKGLDEALVGDSLQGATAHYDWGFWTCRYGRELGETERTEIIRNLVGFFDVLAGWSTPTASGGPLPCSGISSTGLISSGPSTDLVVPSTPPVSSSGRVNPEEESPICPAEGGISEQSVPRPDGGLVEYSGTGP